MVLVAYRIARAGHFQGRRENKRTQRHPVAPACVLWIPVSGTANLRAALRPIVSVPNFV